MHIPLVSVHPIQEIRVRSLHDIENTLKRALWDDADIGAVASPLFKNLIRWFGHVPIIKQVTVLELMSLLLEVSARALALARPLCAILCRFMFYCLAQGVTSTRFHVLFSLSLSIRVLL